MRRIKSGVLVVTMLAMLALVAVPAISQVSFGTDQETDPTGDVSLSTKVSQSGNNSNQCVAPLQFGNTGNFQNAQGFLQYNSTADDIEFDAGDGFTFAPQQDVTCDQKVQQSAAASSTK